jgi:hypothetical protein
MGELFQPTHLLLIPLFLLFGLGCFAIVLVPYWMIYKKAGFSPWLALLMIIPLANLITLYVVAFSEWRVVPAPQPGWVPPPTYPPSYPPQG